MPLGLMPGMPYEEMRFQFEPGDCALLHGDGLAEAHAPDREMFGFPRVSALVGKGPSGEALIDLCLTELGNFTGPDHEQEDDITLVSLQRSPSAWRLDARHQDARHRDARHQDTLYQEQTR
jgi:serine phosphatase RsbU (regulator of sigma subunit)